MPHWSPLKPSSTGYYIASVVQNPKSIRHWNGKKWSEPLVHPDGKYPPLDIINHESLVRVTARDATHIEWYKLVKAM